MGCYSAVAVYPAGSCTGALGEWLTVLLLSAAGVTAVAGVVDTSG